MKKLPPLQFDSLETEVLDFWRQHQVFARSLQQTCDKPRFSFYDGPPFANGLPHFGHSLVTAIKDAMGRYKTMRGYYVERRNGWDTHGLPVEYEIEKKFNISGKKEILALGLEKFNAACRESVFAYRHDWEAFFERIGRWTDTEHAYATMDRNFIESVWWVFKQVSEKGLLYRGYKSMPYCPRCETPLSNFELNEGYRDGVQDPSLYVKFQLAASDSERLGLRDKAFLLAWTTTPWSLPGNVALAVNPTATYVAVELTADSGQSEQLILAQDRLAVLDAEHTVVRRFRAQDLIGCHYEPLFTIDKLPNNPALYQIWAEGFVSTEEGTGVLHVAPAFGEDDLNLAEAQALPVLTTVDSSGRLCGITRPTDLNGQFFKSADPNIIEYLTAHDRVYNAEIINHIYPFCYRCETPLLYYAISTWFVAVSKIRADLLKTAGPINWVPAHVKTGRFGKWLEGARDWAISRNRYWGSPLPIWVNDQDPDDYLVIGSLAELKQLAVEDYDLTDVHRPGIDAVVLRRDGKTYHRVEEVLDCWFESGSMPYAQLHWPFEHETEFSASFPADYVGEGLDQTRLWFYVLHVLATILQQQPAYKNVIVNGIILAADGQKLSKRLRNYPPLEEVFADEGADSLRYYLLSSPASVGDYMRFSRTGLRDVARNLFMTLYNSASFLSLYAEIDGWQPDSLSCPTELTNPLDRWLIARVQQTIAQVTDGADSYDLARATRPLTGLIDDVSNWYVRRSRRRFWKSEDDADKKQAYATLFWALITTCQLLAPWSPFMSDYLWRQLTDGVDGAAESIHLTSWPAGDEIDQASLDQMALVREIISLGLAKRAEAGIKVRQPLARVTVPDRLGQAANQAALIDLIREELNVKTVALQPTNQSPADQPVLTIVLDTTITPELRAEGLARDAIRHIQAARKQAGLQVDDRITLELTVEQTATAQALEQFADLIARETLAQKVKITAGAGLAPDTSIRLGDAGRIGITISKH